MQRARDKVQYKGRQQPCSTNAPFIDHWPTYYLHTCPERVPRCELETPRRSNPQQPPRESSILRPSSLRLAPLQGDPTTDPAWVAGADKMQQRRDEILAKKAKLAELKRQRELRANQANSGRASGSGSGDVCPTLTLQHAIACLVLPRR